MQLTPSKAAYSWQSAADQRSCRAALVTVRLRYCSSPNVLCAGGHPPMAVAAELQELLLLGCCCWAAAM
jgi:hypothetical protein